MISSSTAVGAVGSESAKHSKHRFALRLFYSLIVFVVGAALLPVIPAAAVALPGPQVASAPSAYTGVNPTRVMDTRTGSGLVGAGNTLGPGASFSLVVAPNATAGVPANATAVVMNVTVTNTTAASYLTVYPNSGSVPFASNLNWVAGYTVPNLVTVQPGTGGQVTFYNKFGSVDVIADIAGYFAPPSGSAGGEVGAGFPQRLVDTRAGSGSLGAGSALGPAATANYQVTGNAGVPAAGVSAVILNATVTNTTAASFLTLWPAGATRNTVSNANWVAGWTRANRAIVPVSSTGQISVYNQFGSVDVILDVDGYFTNASASGALYTSVAPVRLADHTALGPNSSVDELVAGRAGVPGNASAAMLNSTVSETTAPSFLTSYPTGSTRPNTSDINWVAGQVNPNLGVSTLGTAGQSTFYNSAGNVNVTIDLEGFFGGAAAGVILTANPSSVPADGTSKSTLTAKVTKADGTAAVGDLVSFTTNGAAGCGTISAGAVATDGTGTATKVNGYTAGTTAGSCTITATEANNANSGTAVITQTVIKNVVTQTPTATVLANGGGLGGTTTITTTVKNNLVGVVGDTINYTLSASVTGSCGSVATNPATTGAGGIATTVYSSSVAVGFCTVTGTETGNGSSASTLITQSGAGAQTSALVANPTSLSADGTSTSALTFTVSGAGAGNDPVAFVVSNPGAPGSCGTLSGVPATTNGSGTATATYTSSTTAGTCDVSASEAGGGTTHTVTITQNSFNSITLTANPSTIPADGATTSALTATVVNSITNAPVSGDSVAFALSGCGTGAITTTNPKLTDASGVATATYRAGVVPSSCTITATEANTAKFTTTIITQTTAVANSVTVTANPTSIPADPAGTQSVITATVTNSAGGPVSTTVTFSTTGTCGTFTAPSVATNPATGVASTNYIASATVTTCTITATELSAGKSGTATVTQTAVKNAVVLAPPTASLAADGVANQTLVATVTNKGVGVVGDTVNYTKSASVTGSCGALSSASGTTGAGGVAPTITYTATLVVGFCTVTATETGNGSSATSVIQQHGSSAGTAITETTNPITLPADGKSTSTVTATVTGAGGGNDPLSFTVSTPSTCGTLSSNFATTNGSGVATVTYTASLNAPLTCTITVVEAAGSKTTSATVAQTVVSNIITGSANPTAIKGDGITTSVVTVHVTSGVDGSNVAGDALVFTDPGANCGGLSGASAKTDASGMGTVTYKSKVAPGTFCDVVATESGTGQSVTVTITQTT